MTFYTSVLFTILLCLSLCAYLCFMFLWALLPELNEWIKNEHTVATSGGAIYGASVWSSQFLPKHPSGFFSCFERLINGNKLTWMQCSCADTTDCNFRFFCFNTWKKSPKKRSPERGLFSHQNTRWRLVGGFRPVLLFMSLQRSPDLSSWIRGYGNRWDGEGKEWKQREKKRVRRAEERKGMGIDG